jgi:hypothetical protein
MKQLLILIGQLKYVRPAANCMYSISDIFNAGMMYSTCFPNAISLRHRFDAHSFHTQIRCYKDINHTFIIDYH